jgi:hypothetical protein
MRIARSPLDTLEPVYQHFPLVSTTRTRNDLRDLRIILIDAKSCCRLTEGSILDGVPRQRVDSAHEAQNYEWPVPTQSQTRNQDTTTASCAAQERFRDLRASAERRDPRRIPIARPIASLTHSAASWSNM